MSEGKSARFLSFGKRRVCGAQTTTWGSRDRGFSRRLERPRFRTRQEPLHMLIRRGSGKPVRAGAPVRNDSLEEPLPFSA